jgi:hypothetical protein
MTRTVPAVIVLLAMVAFSAAGTESTQTKSKSTKPAKQTKTTRTKVSPQAVADSLARAKADSINRVELARAAADSLERARKEGEQRRLDSAKAARFPKIENKAFGVGERLVFDVNYGVVTAGEAVMAIPSYDTVAGRQCYRVEFTVNSLASFSWIYKVEDRYLTFIDVDAIIPWKFEQHIREGGYRRDFIAEFDQVRHVAKTTEGEYQIPPAVHDIMSAFYFARLMDFSSAKPGDIFPLYNFYKDRSHELGVKFLGRAELEVEAGTFRTIVVEPLVKEGGLFKSEGRIVVWLTDDERRIPVRVNTKVVIGSIDTELREYSGLAGPLRARIQ